MATEKSQNVQDVFLNHVRKNKTPVTVFLVNGVKLQGIITWFDNFSVLLRRDGHTQLVYKHAVSTVMPGAPIQLFDPAARPEAATAASNTLTMAPREAAPVGQD
ncbi:MAG: RNA chaperone Hfq [Acidisphaera sp.]|nr:RNA chaperone Hfq [Acidisphaera sp.]MBV9812053.1 RNA chaperone Hfq [Acetobacteraceae bacterium]